MWLRWPGRRFHCSSRSGCRLKVSNSHFSGPIVLIRRGDGIGHKNAGGKPPALGGPSIRRLRFFYSMRLNGF